jgi:cytochrome c oxidase assembly protein subunit 11
MMAPSNARLLKKLIVVAVIMFGFGYAMVPFYNKICEVTGINAGGEQALAVNTQVDAGRWITLQFDANTNQAMPWRFRPLQSSLRIHPGQLVQVEYEVENTTGKPITGQAIPSYGPALAGRYVKKIECFCFRPQSLKGGEKKRLPVMLVLDRAIPNDVNTVTLSYTFFKVEDGKQRNG